MAFRLPLDLFDVLPQHQRRGSKRSAYTVWREIRHSNIWREAGYVKKSRTNKSYAKQAKGFRQWGSDA